MPTTASDALPRGEQIFSESGDYYLLLTTGGTLELRNSDQGLEQEQGATWYLDKNHDYGKIGHEITSAKFTDGQLRVSAPGLPDWCSTKATHPGAKLEIVKDERAKDGGGALRVVDAANPKQVFWSSAYDSAKGGGC